MKTEVDNIIHELSVALEQHGFSDQFVERAIESIDALEIDTVEDRRIVMLGLVQMMDTLLQHVPSDRSDEVKAQRNNIQARYDSFFGSDAAPYSAINRITLELAEGLKQGGSPDELVARANSELVGLSYGEGDAVLAIEGQLRVVALRSARTWFHEATPPQPGELPIVTIIRELVEALNKNGFDKTLILRASEAIQDQPASTRDDRENIASGLLNVWGIGLWSKPDSTPAMEPLRDRIIELTTQLSAEDSTSEVNVQKEGLANQCETILNELATTLERDGFSEYALQQAMGAIQELPAEGEEDYKTINQGFLRMIDIAVPYAPEEFVQSLLISRSTIEQQADLNAWADRQFAPGEMKAECQAIVDELRDKLKAGESPATAVTRAITKFTSLIQHLQ